MLGLAVVPWTDRLIIRAGRPDLAGWSRALSGPVVAMLSAATVGAVLASRRPCHPVGWLLLARPLADRQRGDQLLRPTGWSSVPGRRRQPLRPGLRAADLPVPGHHGLILLLTDRFAPDMALALVGRVSTGALAVVLVSAMVAPGSLDPVRMTVRGPLDPLCYGEALRAANVLAQAVAVLIILAGAGRWWCAPAVPAA